MPRERIAELVAQHDLAPAAPARLARLLELLSADGRAPTTVRDPAVAVDVHVADSLSGLEVDDVRAAEVIGDIGAGAGFPALALAIALPATKVIAVESVRRKCTFLEQAVVSLSLANVEVVCCRAEEWRAGLARCDVVCARAVARLGVLCEYAAPLLRVGGTLVAWKGHVEGDEDRDARFAAQQVGMSTPVPRLVSPYASSHSRRLYVSRKTAATPPGFPRRPGMAAKRPLTGSNSGLGAHD